MAGTAETAASCAYGTPIAVGNRCHPMSVTPRRNALDCYERLPGGMYLHEKTARPLGRTRGEFLIDQ